MEGGRVREEEEEEEEEDEVGGEEEGAGKRVERRERGEPRENRTGLLAACVMPPRGEALATLARSVRCQPVAMHLPSLAFGRHAIDASERRRREPSTKSGRSREAEW
ncbi:hypothetical protein KM043_008380 [Ampulex compressa]|nr:hypothetical protein KM043_008380 [Ampulex compressa]